MGRLLTPLDVNDCPVARICVICTADESEFTSETVALAVCPIGTEPKVTVPGEACKAPVLAAPELADPELAALATNLPPPQPDKINVRQHEIRKRRNAGQRQNCTTCLRECESHRTGSDRWRGEVLAVVKLYPNNALEAPTCSCLTLYDLYKCIFLPGSLTSAGLIHH